MVINIQIYLPDVQVYRLLPLGLSMQTCPGHGLAAQVAAENNNSSLFKT